LIRGNRVSQGLSDKVMMLVRPSGRIRNLVGIRGCGKNLRHKRVRVERDARNQLIKLGRRQCETKSGEQSLLLSIGHRLTYCITSAKRHSDPGATELVHYQ
jgi:hypothetical protein